MKNVPINLIPLNEPESKDTKTEKPANDQKDVQKKLEDRLSNWDTKDEKQQNGAQAMGAVVN